MRGDERVGLWVRFAAVTAEGYVFVVGEPAGGTEHGQVEAAQRVLDEAAPTALCRVSDAADIEAAIGRLDGRVLVVGGGDGTLHLAVAVLHRRGWLNGTAVGLVPLGTGNDTARALGLPIDASAAARRVAAGRRRPIDLITTEDGEVVVNGAHAGLGAAAVQDAAPLKPVLGRVAYRLGAIWAGLRRPGVRLRVVLDGTTIHDGDPLILAGVLSGSSIGGGTPLCPPARIDDGRLDVVIARDLGRRSRAQFAASLRSGSHLGLDLVRHATGMVADVSGSRTRWNVDGEIGPPLARRKFSVLPGALTVIA